MKLFSVAASVCALALSAGSALAVTVPSYGDVVIVIPDGSLTFKANSTGAQVTVPAQAMFIASDYKAKAAGTVNFYLSTNSQYDVADQFLATKDVSGIKVGKLKNVKMKFNLTAADRGKYIIAHIDSANDTGGIFEADDTTVEQIPFNAF